MPSVFKIAALLLCFGAVGKSAASGEPAATFQTVRTPAVGSPLAIGDYSSGCVRGALALPLDGPGYQVMHPSRLRYFGHPELVGFVQQLGGAVADRKLGVLLVGDLSQPRGGRASGGHASHQTGLDVDLWYTHPKSAERGRLPAAERESAGAKSVLDSRTSSVRKRWAHKVTELLRISASDARVERIFVHPIIKREQCAKETGDRAWLAKLRPWYGHDDHFHVRLGCPKDSPECTKQEPAPKGDGCAELDWWFNEETRADRELARSRYRSKVVSPREPPGLCREVLASK